MGLAHIRIALLVAISCIVLVLLVLTQNCSGIWALLACSHMEVRRNLLTTSLYEFCRSRTGASEVLLGGDL